MFCFANKPYDVLLFSLYLLIITGGELRWSSVGTAQSPISRIPFINGLRLGREDRFLGILPISEKCLH